MAGIFLVKNAVVPKDILPANTNQALAILRLDPKKANPIFISYYLRQPQVIDFVNNMSGQSAQPNINFEEIKSIDLLLPSLDTQKSIASILSSLDDKIDLLHRQNATLEKMAETLFRQWFVEEAKEDWEIGRISDLIDFNPTRKLTKGTIAPFLEMSELSTITYSPSSWYDRAFSSGSKFKNGDTLLARITPCLENGKAAYIDFLEDEQIAWGSTEFIVMSPKNNLQDFFAYVIARFQDFKDFAESCMQGSSGRQRVDIENLKSYEIAIPSDDVINDFNKFCLSIVPKLKSNQTQIRTLTTLRDTLLPKLMRGEVRVEM
ncbi:MAG: restriction endonuclease subunit S [Bacteroidales bacterium]|nr:restriction endonuclease subunit S [Bacteroidales bacterium]